MKNCSKNVFFRLPQFLAKVFFYCNSVGLSYYLDYAYILLVSDVNFCIYHVLYEDSVVENTIISRFTIINNNSIY